MATSVLVAHAGSLITLLQRDLVPGFTAHSGYTVTRQAGPAVGLANQIRRNELAPDVYMSADAEVNRLLMGAAQRDKVRWFFGFARTRMVLAYSPQSRFKADFEAAAAGQKLWYEVLQTPGLVFRRSDPRTDPGGYRSVFVCQLAEQFYQQPGLRDAILQGDDNEAQLIMGVPPNMTDGSIDAMLLYVTAALDNQLPYIQLPDAIDLSNPAFAAAYRAASYTNPQGQTFQGTPAIYSITIPVAAANPQGAVAFVAYVLSEAGRRAVARHGFLPTVPLIGGDISAIPPALEHIGTERYAP